MEHLEPLALRTVDQDGYAAEFFLPRNEKGLPYLLGTGRNAVVFFARTRPFGYQLGNENKAIKLLKADSDEQYADLAARRFFDEIEKIGLFTRDQETLVRFYGKGVLGAIERWQAHFSAEQCAQVAHPGAEYERLMSHYKLQGPFYVLELCQGTLYDLLEKDRPWISFPVYEALPDLRENVIEQAEDDAARLREVMNKYIDGSIAGKSGYDILRAFKTDEESNRVRNNAVLELFADIVLAVWQLHEERPARPGRLEKKALAHRDLKPGNVFLQHMRNPRGISEVTIKLSDLGYVSGAEQLNTGDSTIRLGLKGAAAPGSQFFRAPEQLELPVEVRVDFDLEHPQIAYIKSSKLSAINKGDFLAIGDKFSDDAQTDEGLYDIGVFRIERAALVSQNLYELEVDPPFSFERNRDLQAHIIRSTGFHTDGFSLGAMLYDLISGGRNAETFYTYCLLIFTEQFAANYGFKTSYSVEDVVKILCPEDDTISVNETRLSADEKRVILQQVLATDDVDALISKIAAVSLANVPAPERARLGIGEKLRLAGQIQGAAMLDDLVFDLIKSPAFQPPNGHHAPALAPPQQHALYEQLKNYRFRQFHVVDKLLVDMRGVRIPREIIRIIVKCMLRDIEGSYYSCSNGDGYNSPENRRRTKDLYDDIHQLLKAKAFQLPEAEFPRALRKQLLFKLRGLVLDS